MMAAAAPTIPMSIERLADWPDRLDRFLRERADMPFAWGSNDCVTFAADALAAMTGAELLTPIWHSAITAKAAIGSESLLVRADRVMQKVFSQIPRAFARRGDIGLGDGEHGPTLVVKTVSYWVGPGTTHMLAMPDEKVALSWAIGWRP